MPDLKVNCLACGERLEPHRDSVTSYVYYECDTRNCTLISLPVGMATALATMQQRLAEHERLETAAVAFAVAEKEFKAGWGKERCDAYDNARRCLESLCYELAQQRKDGKP